MLEQLGDKVGPRHRPAGRRAGAGRQREPLADAAEVLKLAEKLGYPVIVKAARAAAAAACGVVNEADELAAFARTGPPRSRTRLRQFAKSFSKSSSAAPAHRSAVTGGPARQPGPSVERDCSLQRRHQKVVEIAPASNLDPEARATRFCEAALADRPAGELRNAGTVEFLLDTDTGKFYFIEVNPRIQVEHTVTEVVTGIDIVKCQILVAQGTPGRPRNRPGRSGRDRARGFAMQCRVTTEDPENGFLPDYGRITHYRSAGGIGRPARCRHGLLRRRGHAVLRFAAGQGHGLGPPFPDAARRMERCLQEFRIRGVKTNIPFLINLVTHPKFLAGGYTTRFLDETPELFQFTARADRATKIVQLSGRRDRQRPSAVKNPAPAGSRQRSRRRSRGSTALSRAAAGHARQAQGAGARQRFAAGSGSRSGC